ncbi:hypothetical protein BaRGS_00016087 [Batillaria attramentaria]|uniref:Uncharacterized protein n=1 Tax=Batillaria attramentaria TaxID=370345 RepID=A0ABD0KZC9_9CAEN
MMVLGRMEGGVGGREVKCCTGRTLKDIHDRRRVVGKRLRRRKMSEVQETAIRGQRKLIFQVQCSVRWKWTKQILELCRVILGREDWNADGQGQGLLVFSRADCKITPNFIVLD